MNSIATGPIDANGDPIERRLRILSYNVQIGISTRRYRHYMTHSWKHVLPYAGRRGNLDSIGRFLKHFDLVGLQEVDAGSLRTQFINQAEYLARRGDFPNWHSQTNRNFGRFAQHGQGVLSRFQSHGIIEHRLPGRIPGRGVLEVRYGRPELPLTIFLLHLSLGRRARRCQLDYITTLLRERLHVIVMGDMNCPLQSVELQTLLRNTRLTEPAVSLSTYPSWRPARNVDHILVTPDLWIKKTTVYPINYSDHLPIGIELALPEEIHLEPVYAAA